MDGDPEPALGADEEEIRIGVILADDEASAVVGEISADVDPRIASVRGLIDVGSIIVAAVAVIDHIGDLRIEVRGLDLADPAVLGFLIWDVPGDVAPDRSAVAARPQQAIVGSSPEHSSVERRLSHGMQRVVSGMSDIRLGLEAVLPRHVRPQDLPVTTALREFE